MNDKEFLVPVDDLFCQMMNEAVRYACGRRTYAVMDTTNYITNLIPYLNDKTLKNIIKDVERQKEMPGSLGDACDEVCWLQFQDRCKEELERRSNENSHKLINDEWYNKLP